MHFAFSLDRLRSALLLHVQQGPPATRHLRQEEADGCMNFMQSDAAMPLRLPITVVNVPAIAPGDRDLDAVGTSGCKATVETGR